MKRIKYGVALSMATTLAMPAVAFAEEDSSSSGISLLIPKPAEFIPALVVFLVIWIILAKLVWPKVLAALDARTEKIEGAIADAEKERNEAVRLREEADATMLEAHRKAAEIVLEARSDAEDVRAKVIADAHNEAGEIVAQAKEHAANEQRMMYDRATDSIAKMSVNLASKIVDENLKEDDELQRALIKKYLTEVGNLND